MTNLEIFEKSLQEKEDLIDKNYHKQFNVLVIPKTKDEWNDLTKANETVIDYITAIEKNLEMNINIDDIIVEKMIMKIIEELKIKGMNYSALSQYFNVHNMNYSIFEKKSEVEKVEILKFIIKKYIEHRHKVYKSQGYSNIVLQVMSDNYSHKRKGSYGANKLGLIFEDYEIMDLLNLSLENPESYYLKSDKSGKNEFIKFAKEKNITLTTRGMTTKKYPDALLKIGEDYFIIEQKNMKENGGGQDKQTSEITEFINRNPEFEKLHYITYIEGEYFYQLNENATGKNRTQYLDIVQTLKNYQGNYFVNTYGLKYIIESYLEKNKKKKDNINIK